MSEQNKLERYKELSQWDHVFNGDEKQELESLTVEIQDNIEFLKAEIEGKIEKAERCDTCGYDKIIDEFATATTCNQCVKVKDLESQVAKLKAWQDEQIIVYKDLSREATDYRNENTELKKELESWKNTVITQHKVFEEQEKQIEQLKSTLDKIDKLFSSWLDGNTNLGNFCTEYKEITAKHENDKNE